MTNWNQDMKQLKKNVAILMQNQNLQQSFTESNTQADIITYIHLAKIRHVISGLVKVLSVLTTPAIRTI